MEKPSIKKIRRLLEISERERHCLVLLNSENINVVRRNPAPYTLPVIPRPLPSSVVEGKHFVIADLRRLVSGSTSSSRNPTIEASSRVQGAGSTPRSSGSSSEGSSSSPPVPGQRTMSDHPERLLPPERVAGPVPPSGKGKAEKGVRASERVGSKGEDFIPWIPADMEGPQDLEEEERDERMTGLLDRYAARKRKRQVIFSCESDTAPVLAMKPNQSAVNSQPAADESLGDQVIIIPCSPELELIGRTESDRAGRS